MGEVVPFARVTPAEVSGLAAAGLSPALSPQFQDYNPGIQPREGFTPVGVTAVFSMLKVQNEQIRKLRGMIQTCFMELHATQATLFPDDVVEPVELKTITKTEYDHLRACALAVEAALMEIS